MCFSFFRKLEAIFTLARMSLMATLATPFMRNKNILRIYVCRNIFNFYFAISIMENNLNIWALGSCVGSGLLVLVVSLQMAANMSFRWVFLLAVWASDGAQSRCLDIAHWFAFYRKKHKMSLYFESDSKVLPRDVGFRAVSLLTLFGASVGPCLTEAANDTLLVVGGWLDRRLVIVAAGWTLIKAALKSWL